ncbi:uracil-DNA glycosylase family protein [Bdellovibrionota bacterium FG-2]
MIAKKVSDALTSATDEWLRKLKPLRFKAPVAFVYNPLEYARKPWDEYVARFGSSPRRVILLGMNPGPFGMAQTGIPFGEISMVRDWLGIEAPVGKPSKEHPQRPVEGFACTRSEVSGKRLWGWAKDKFHTPEKFFSEFFVANYCPLVFMEASGKNFTPDHLPKAEQQALFSVCDEALVEMVRAMNAEVLIGVGAFAETRAHEALEGCKDLSHVRIHRILHPSPASPKANKNWAAEVDRQLKEIL